MGRQMASLDCPKSMVGRVIGKSGETIRALQHYTGALIQIDQTLEPTKVHLSGAPRSLELAVSMVTDIVKGTFKGFALLRQIATNLPDATATYQPVYAPGYGLIPPSQIYGQYGRAFTSVPATDPPPATAWVGGAGKTSPIPEETPPSSVILELSQLNLDRTARLASPTVMTDKLMQTYELDPNLPCAASPGTDSSAPSAPVSAGLTAPSMLTSSTSTTTAESNLYSLLVNSPPVGEPEAFLQQQMQYGTHPSGPFKVVGKGVFAGWILLTDPDGRPFCLNPQTGQTEWLHTLFDNLAA
eukprot:evm.model.scf_1666.1 EVM.evm.TU.scf_1666.1   scf_1666:6619-9159(-)